MASASNLRANCRNATAWLKKKLRKSAKSSRISATAESRRSNDWFDHFTLWRNFMSAKRSIRPVLFAALSAAAIGMVGCDQRENNTNTPPVTNPPPRQTNVNVGPGGVDVEVDKAGKKKVDVEVGGGRGVNVDVDKK